MSTLSVKLNPAFEAATGSSATELGLDLSKFVEVLSVKVGSSKLDDAAGYTHAKDDDKLNIAGAAVTAALAESPDSTFTVETLTRHKPADNTELSGLYKAQGGKMFIT